MISAFAKLLVLNLVLLAYAHAEFVEGTVDLTFPTEKPDHESVIWKGFDFVTGKTVDAPTHGSSLWDIRLKQAYIGTNGGEVVRVDVADFASVKTAPPAPDLYVRDSLYDASGPAPLDKYNSILMTWFDYSLLHHLMSAKDSIYVIRTRDDHYVKIQFLDYIKDGEALRPKKVLGKKVMWPAKVMDADRMVHVKFRYKYNRTYGDKALE